MQWSLFLLILMGQCSFFMCHLYEYHFIEENKTWDEAQTYCREKYTDLATVANMTNMMRLRKPTENQGEAWIGLYNQKDANKTWKWSLPGVEFDESEAKWSTGEPNDKRPGENCVFLYEDCNWGDLSCEDDLPFFCYNETNSFEKIHLIENKMKWLQAQSYCREHHTDLVSRLNMFNYDKLKSKIMSKDKQKYWMGLFRDTWRWSDNSRSSFRHWDHNYSDTADKKKCAMTMLNETGRWKVDKCDENKPFFCYDDKVILIKEKKTWEEALYYCRENHSDLVSITDRHQQRWVQERAKNADTHSVWLGLSYICSLDLWFWVSDKLVCYENWAEGKMENCNMSGTMERGGQHKWSSQHDHEKSNFICAL